MLAITFLAVCALFPAALFASATSGTFSILSFSYDNTCWQVSAWADLVILHPDVAGLPDILNNNEVPGDNTTNTARIGSLLSQYNYSLVHVQEDFNYHATLYANDDHPYRTATSGGVPFGSGLNSLSLFDWVDFERIKWDTCSNASGSDCLTPKGFTFMRLRISEGVYVDAYNLHADAGTESDDLAARAANLRQVSSHINTYAAGNAVLVFGDTNSRYTRTADVPALFISSNGMTDAWVELARGGVIPTVESLCENPSTTISCEIVDKVWYRASPALALKASTFQYAGNKFLQTNGSILSDHNPVLVDFKWTLSNTLRISDFVGGPHGDYYNDLPTLSGNTSPKASSITLRGASRLDAVSITLSTGQTLTHGETGGTASTLTLASGERLVSATICQGKYNDETRIFYMQVTTSSGKTASAGKTTSDCATMSAESGFGIVGFTGRSGDEIDRIAVIYGKV